MNRTSTQPFASIFVGLLTQIQTIIPKPTTTAESTRKVRLLLGSRIDSEFIGLIHYWRSTSLIIWYQGYAGKSQEFARLVTPIPFPSIIKMSSFVG